MIFSSALWFLFQRICELPFNYYKIANFFSLVWPWQMGSCINFTIFFILKSIGSFFLLINIFNKRNFIIELSWLNLLKFNMGLLLIFCFVCGSAYIKNINKLNSTRDKRIHENSLNKYLLNYVSWALSLSWIYKFWKEKIVLLMKQLTFLHTAKPLRGNCIEKLK